MGCSSFDLGFEITTDDIRYYFHINIIYVTQYNTTSFLLLFDKIEIFALSNR